MGLFSDAFRLLKIAKKPSREELWLVIRVTAIGIVFMGLLGFLIRAAFQTIFEPILKG